MFDFELEILIQKDVSTWIVSIPTICVYFSIYFYLNLTFFFPLRMNLARIINEFFNYSFAFNLVCRLFNNYL